MTVTVVDGTNLEQIMADAGVEAPEAAAAPAAAPAEPKPQDREPKGAEVQAKEDPEQDDADDEEDEDGTSARQKRELSAKMLKAIGKKHRQVKEAEEFAADQIRLRREADSRAADLDRRLKEIEARDKPAPQQEAKEPQREDFATDAEFIKASVKWGVDQGIREREEQRQAAERMSRVQAQFQRAVELVPDFEETVKANLAYPSLVADYMRESDLFAELGYHFAKNPKVLEELSALKPMQQVARLGKIEATLRPFGSSESSPKAEDDKPSNGKAAPAAPSTQDTGFSPSKARSDAPVIKPLTNSESSQVDPDARDMDTRQMIEAFQKTKKVNLHARKRH